MSTPAIRHKREQLSQRYILWLTLLTVAGGWAIALGLRYLAPDLYPRLFPYILVYFYLWGLGYRWLLNRPNEDAKWATRNFMLFKSAKFVVSLILVGAYLVLGQAGNEAHPFVLSFLFFYLAYLVFETRFFVLYEKCRKDEKR